jgi:hypothetical protein
MHIRATALALAIFASGSQALAQNSAMVDQATFMVTKKGAPAGRESFSIVRSAGAGGQVFKAQATSAIGDTRYSSVLTTDSAGSPLTYELRLGTRAEQTQFLQGRGRPDRFSVLIQTKRGEASKEYAVRRGTVLLDDELFHQFYFVVLAGLATADSALNVIAPRDAAQGRHRLEFRGIEVVVVGGQNLTGRRFALWDANTMRADVWIDAVGRLLKVSVPDKALVALRDDPPR